MSLNLTVKYTFWHNFVLFNFKSWIIKYSGSRGFQKRCSTARRVTATFFGLPNIFVSMLLLDLWPYINFIKSQSENSSRLEAFFLSFVRRYLLFNLKIYFFFFVESGNKDEFEKRSKETKTWYTASIISGIIIIGIYLIITLVWK